MVPARPRSLVTEVAAGQVFDTTVLSDVDALVVGGGVTPDYLGAIAPLVDQLRLLVADGLPYLGYSAGAMIAADRALVGGWRIGGVEICPEEASEGLDEVELREGLGLVDLTIDVHAVQAGTLARLIASAEAEFVTAGLAIDEDTALVVGEGALEVRGHRQRLARHGRRGVGGRRHDGRVAVVEPRPLADLVDPGWASALAPVEDDVHRMGAWLRDETAAGRPYLPAGADVLRAFTTPVRRRQGARRRAGPLPDARPPDRTVVRRRPRRPPGAAQSGEHLQGAQPPTSA